MLALYSAIAACQSESPTQQASSPTEIGPGEIESTQVVTSTPQPTATPTVTSLPAPTQTVPPPSIDGHVTAAGSGEPLAEARVEIRTGQNLDDLVAYAQTDQDGYFRIDNLPDGVYYALAFADGYARELYQQVTALQEATVLKIEGSPLTGINFALNDGGSISGVLTIGGDQPAANVVVSAVEAKYAWADVHKYHAASDENGYYQISHLPLGEYVVVVEDVGYATEFYDNTYFLSLAKIVEVRPPEEIGDINLQLEPEGKINGVVIDDETGEPVTNNKVHLNLKGPPGAYTWGIVDETKSSNTFSIGRLPPGKYLLSTRSEGYADEIYDHKTGWELATYIQLEEGEEESDITLRMRKGGTIRGNLFDVDGEPLEAFLVDVQLTSTDHASAMPYHTEMDGSFYFHMPPGTFIVYSMFVPGYVPKYYGDTYYPESAKALKVNSGDKLEGIDIYLELAGKISGMVFEADGQTPVPEAQVYAFPLDAKIGAGAITGPDGAYIIEGIPSGRYRIEVKVPGNPTTYYYPGATDQSEADSVIVSAPGITEGVDISMP